MSMVNNSNVYSKERKRSRHKTSSWGSSRALVYKETRRNSSIIFGWADRRSLYLDFVPSLRFFFSKMTPLSASTHFPIIHYSEVLRTKLKPEDAGDCVFSRPKENGLKRSDSKRLLYGKIKKKVAYYRTNDNQKKLQKYRISSRVFCLQVTVQNLNISIMKSVNNKVNGVLHVHYA